MEFWEDECLGAKRNVCVRKYLSVGSLCAIFFLFFYYLQANEKLQSFQGAFSFVFWFFERESVVFCFCVQLYPLLFFVLRVFGVVIFFLREYDS
jgi:hypothetical protein